MKVDEIWICTKFCSCDDVVLNYPIGEKVKITDVDGEYVSIIRIDNLNSEDVFIRLYFIQHFRKCWE